MTPYEILTARDVGLPNVRRVVPTSPTEALVLAEDTEEFAVYAVDTAGRCELLRAELATASEGGRWMLARIDAMRKAEWRPI